MNVVFYLHDEPSAEAFEQKLLWFRRRFRLVSYAELMAYLRGELELRGACHLTVDDGWLSTYRVIFPVLRKYGVPMTIFVSPRVCRSGENFWYADYGDLPEALLRRELVARRLFDDELAAYPLDLIFKELPVDRLRALLSDVRRQCGLGPAARAFVNADEVREMAASGLVEVGAHTMIHPVLANESAERSLAEISQSVEGVAELLDREVTAFAYPNGLGGVDFTQREADYARRCGIRAAFSVDPGAVRPGLDMMALPRVGSLGRLRLGRLGLALPSLARQADKRAAIRRHRLGA